MPLRDEIAAWCIGRWWWWRAPLLAYLGFAGIRRLDDVEFHHLFGGLTLGVHEAGHLLFGWFGELPGVAGGSLMQVLAPILAGWILLRQGDWFGLSVAGGWLASSLANLAWYVGDALARQLALVGFSNEPAHDWFYLLGEFDALGRAAALARAIRVVSFSCLLVSVLFGAWLCLQMRPAGDPA